MGGCSSQVPAASPPVKGPGTHWTGACMDPRAGLDECISVALTGSRSTERPAINEALYRLHYPGPRLADNVDIISVIN
jgi:hypothetical protein